MDPLANKEYTIGWICALPLEMAAACAMLDANHGQPTEQHAKDCNVYSLGSIGKHNIVITCLPLGIYGMNSAAVVVDQMLFSFPSVRFAFMVGIGGGIPSGDHDIRLGDVVVSVPDETFGGVVQYDYGKTVAEGKLKRTGVLNKPPLSVLKAVSRLQMEYEFGRSQIPQYLSDTFHTHTDPNFRVNYSYQGAENDILYEANSTHVGHGGTGQDCDGPRIVPRPPRENNDPVVHYGIIASGNQVMKDAETRDRIGNELGALCFEMEAAGLMDNFPCLVVRGICDYSDRHKNKLWQRYAAITAAAYAKELLGVITPHQVDSMSTAIEALKGELKKINDKVSEVKQKIVGIEEEKLRTNTLDWLKAVDYGPRHSEICSERQEGTGLWFINSRQFNGWLNSDDHTLFCPGIPGSGKTVMASVVIEHLLTTFPGESQIGVAFLYCDYNMCDQQSAVDLLSALLLQLTQQQRSIPDPVRTLYERFQVLNRRPPFSEIVKTLLSVIRCFKRVFFVVDALDECKDDARKSLLSTIRGLQKQSMVKLIATSRPIAVIALEFEKDISIEIRATREDVERYLHDHMSDLPNFITRNPSLLQNVKDEIMEAVSGMFLLARLHLDSLKYKASEKSVMSAVKDLPRGEGGLTKAYDEAVKRIKCQPTEYSNLANRVLQWIVHARRLLTPRELQHALAVEPGRSELDYKNLPDISAMVSVCAGLVMIDQESNRIRLVHYSTREYFQHSQNSWLVKAEVDIASTCLRYLSFTPFATGVCHNDQELEVRLAYHVFLEYAAQYWGIHSHGIEPEIKGLAIAFLKNSQLTSTSWQAGFDERGIYDHSLTEVTGLHLTVHFELPDLVSELVSQGCDIDREDSADGTPLVWALKRRHYAMVELLLDKGADLNKGSICGEHALHTAILNGDKNIAQLLIERDAALEAVDNLGRTALHLAADGGRLEVVDILLQAGAAVNAEIIPLEEPGDALENIVSKYQDIEIGFTALHLAARNGDEAIVQLLIQNGADVHGVSQYSLTSVLHCAVKYGNLEVIKLVLDGGAALDDAQYHGLTALHIAIREGHEAVAQFLISRGADLIGEANQKSPLHLAVKYDQCSMAQILIENGANVNAVASSYTALHIAALKGYLNVVELLLGYGADVTVQSKHQGTAFKCAVAKGHAAVVRLLARYEEDIDKPLASGMTAADIAANYGHEEVLRILVDLGANVKYGSTLYASMNSPSGAAERIASLLLRKGASVNLKIAGSTPLHRAAKRSDSAVLKLLLEYNADVNMQDDRGNTALHMAMKQGTCEAARLLIEYGADVEVCDNNGMTPLHYMSQGLARESSSMPTMAGDFFQAVAEAKANLNPSNERGETVLHYAAMHPTPTALQVMECLLMAGANTETLTKDGRTALHLAVRAGGRSAVLLLLRHMVMVSPIDRNGETPLSYARMKGLGEIADVLVKAGAMEVDCSWLTTFACQERLWRIQDILKTNVDQDPQDARLLRELCQSAADGHIEPMQLLLMQGIDINGVDSDGMTAVEAAAEYQREAVLLFLLEHGADATWRALRSAVCSGNADVVQLLIEQKSLVEWTTRTYELAALLYSAAESGNAAVVHVLIQHGFDVNARHNNWKTALYAAVENGDYPTVCVLLQNKADAELKDGNGISPLSLASSRGNERVVRLLLDHGAPVEPLALCLASGNGHYRVLCALLERKPDVNVTTFHGVVTNLEEKEAAVGLLLPPNVPNDMKTNNLFPTKIVRNKATVLQVASVKGHREIVHLLLKHGADANARDRLGHTALHYVASLWAGDKESASDHAAIVALLLNYNGDVNMKNNGGETALHCAARSGHMDILNLLLGHGAVNLGNSNGKTALHEASKHQDNQVLRLFLRHGDERAIRVQDNTGKCALHYAAEFGQEVNVGSLLEYHADIWMTDHFEKTALHYAAAGGHEAVTKLLLEQDRLLVDARSLKGNTALHLAAKHLHKTVIETLLNYGANINCKDYSGLTALYCAASQDRWSAGYKNEQTVQETVQTLLDRGADVDISNDQG